MMSAWECCLVHDRPVRGFAWGEFARYAGAFGGLAIIVYFAVQIYLTKHMDPRFKYGSIAVIVIIGIVGALAILQRDPAEQLSGDRLYTAEEVAELLNAVRAGGGRFVEAASRAPATATCVFCGNSDAEIRGLDGTRYHRACFQRAYREREASSRRRRDPVV
jgi:hypothetical protein